MKNTITQIETFIDEALSLYDLPGIAVSVKVGGKGPERLCGLNVKRAAGVKDVETNGIRIEIE